MILQGYVGVRVAPLVPRKGPVGRDTVVDAQGPHRCVAALGHTAVATLLCDRTDLGRPRVLEILSSLLLLFRFPIDFVGFSTGQG